MNNLQPYEKHLADKLQQVPVPDKDEGWKEMRKLLDRDKPEGGAGWSGNRKWWWMGITVAIIIGGLWVSQEFGNKPNTKSTEILASSNSVSSDQLAGESVELDRKKENDENVKNENGSKKEGQVTVSSVETNNNREEPTKNRNSDQNADASDIKKESNIKSAGNGITTTTKDGNKENIRSPRENEPGTFIPSAGNNKTGSSKTSKNKANKKREGLNDAEALSASGVKQGNTLNDEANYTNKVIPGIETLSQSASNRTYVSRNPEDKSMISSSIQPMMNADISFQDPADFLNSLSSTIAPLKAEPGKTDKAFAKEMRKKSIKEDKRKMSAGSMRGAVAEKDHELTFAAGLALPQSFAIGSQQSPAYGVNASSSRVSDYLPVPFFQYHVNPRLFLQTELQFQSPQYTNRLLIYQNQQQVSTSSTLEKNIFVEKLYYFHIPFNVYFSPARNFYLGSGLQFSSLLSGVATYQNNSYNGGTLSGSTSRVQGFKDDSVAAKLASSEWRYQFDANYYFKRFTLGARYNQALKQFVDLQPSPTLPFTQGRNQSFLIYLRYNIWEERKKGTYYADN